MSNNEASPNTGTERYLAEALVLFSTDLLQKSGLSHERAKVVAETLVEADLMGHTTHGLHLLPAYLRELEAGFMAKEGDPLVIADSGASMTWDGNYLPGPWLVTQAIDLALERIASHPVITIVIRQSHHIASLVAYLKRATDRGYVILLATSDPAAKGVAPFGGIEPLYTPDPLAAGIPTHGDPILLDISMSTTTMGLVGRLHQQNQPLPHPWLLDNQGNPSDDPSALYSDPPGSILPLGGTDLGFKGFALGLLIEALTGALAGQGRSTGPKRWGASVFLQLINPGAFGGSSAFTQETEWLAEASRNSTPKPGGSPVGLPGSRGLQLRTEQLRDGVSLYPTIAPALEICADKLGVAFPMPITQSSST